MVLTAHQPAYLPWIGLFQKISMADTFCLFDCVPHSPRSFESRNLIKTATGAQWLTVPVLSKGHRQKQICDIEIDNSTDWRRKHWRTIELAYGKAPYFNDYAPSLEWIYKQEWQFLSKLCEFMLIWFLQILDIKVQFYRASDFDFQGTKSDLVLDMCQKMNATEYIFGAMGADYADMEAFEAAGIKVRFQDYKHPVYSQLHGEFKSHLSIVDLIFNEGPRSREIILGE